MQPETPFDVRLSHRIRLYIVVLLIPLIAISVYFIQWVTLNGGNQTTAQIMGFFCLIIGFFILVAGVNLMIRVFGPRPKMQAHFPEYYRSIRQGHYEDALQLINRLMNELPNFETRIPAMSGYAQAGKFADVKHLADLVLQELLAKPAREQKRHRLEISTAYSIWGDTELYQGKLDTATQCFKQAAEYEDLNYALNNNLAKLALLQGDPDAALIHLDAAVLSYRTGNVPVTGQNKAMRAWAFAMKGEFNEAETLMAEALTTPPEDYHADLAEINCIRGYMLRTAQQLPEAEQAFQKAIELDLDGAEGIVARRELGLTTI